MPRYWIGPSEQKKRENRIAREKKKKRDLPRYLQENTGEKKIYIENKLGGLWRKNKKKKEKHRPATYIGKK